MIRDYKFKRTEWTLSKKRRLGPGLLVKALVIALLAGVGYGGYLLLTSRGTDREAAPPAEVDAPGDSGVIELQLPPNPNAAASSDAAKP